MPHQGERVLDVRAFYDHHPINADDVLARARARRGRIPGRQLGDLAGRQLGDLAGPLAADDLFDFDQDHYGGLAAVDELARLAGIGPGACVLDVCAGLGGPARFLATRRGAQVVALELHAGRARGAASLTREVGLEDGVRVVRADARRLPFGSGRFDACVSEEALLHIDDKPAVLAGCRRVLRAGGRLAFTDWTATPRLEPGERERLERWMAATTLQSLAGYRELLGRTGFCAIHAEDVSDAWRPILRERLLMYRSLRAPVVARFGERWYADYQLVYGFFVGLVEAGKLGGGRFAATA